MMKEKKFKAVKEKRYLIVIDSWEAELIGMPAIRETAFATGAHAVLNVDKEAVLVLYYDKDMRKRGYEKYRDYLIGAKKRKAVLSVIRECVEDFLTEEPDYSEDDLETDDYRGVLETTDYEDDFLDTSFLGDDEDE